MDVNIEKPIWDKFAQEQFNQMIAKIPVFLRSIAQTKVAQRAVDLAVNGKRPLVTQKDMVDAFFAETPFGFHGPMKTDMQAVGIDYTQYGY